MVKYNIIDIGYYRFCDSSVVAKEVHISIHISMQSCSMKNQKSISYISLPRHSTHIAPNTY
jgi:hypothetical protein